MGKMRKIEKEKERERKRKKEGERTKEIRERWENITLLPSIPIRGILNAGILQSFFKVTGCLCVSPA